MSREILKLENIEKYYSGNIDKLHIIKKSKFNSGRGRIYLDTWKVRIREVHSFKYNWSVG